MFTLSEGKGLEAMGLEPGEVVGQPVFEMYAHLPEVLDDVRGALSGEERASTVELGELTFATRYSPARDETGEVMGVIGVASDITDRRKLEKELEFQAFHDSLTGLPNRALFSDRLEHALDRCARRSDSISVLFLDLDDFKIINDTLGHIAGDWLLKAVAERLISCVRPEDTVARLGGDEFALLLEGTSRDGALLVAQRIERELAKPVIVEHDRRKISTNVSIGIVVEEAAGGEASSREGELLRMADLAMYRAKRNGKASHYVFDPTEDVPYLEAESLRRRGDELQRAIEQDELEVHYQCVVSLETGKVTGFEALVSWAHPERGLLPPDEFIPLAEESGLIGELSLWVLRHACQQVKWWREQNPEIATPRMSVNLSAKQLSHPGLVSEVATVLEEYSLEPSLLQLELTESATIEDPAAGSTIEEIKALGVSIAIDDFGTGYSSITYLTQFPADTVKIDRSIVANLESEEVRGEAVISAIVTLAHSLGDVVVAEGVENAGQLEHLRKLGCEFAQGFHLCPPYLAEEAFAFYRKRL